METTWEEKVKKIVCILLMLANLAFVSCSKSDGGNEIKIDKPTADAFVSLNGDEISDFAENYITGAGYAHINKTLGDKGIRSPEYLAGLIAAMKAFAVKDNYPIYFHCQIGRDRTGTIAYMLNGLLGVDHYTLTMDYELSCFSVAGCVDYDDKEKQAKNMAGAMDAMYSYFMKYSKYKGSAEASVKDGIEKFLLDNGVTADEIANIREIMTEESVNAG